MIGWRGRATLGRLVVLGYLFWNVVQRIHQWKLFGKTHFWVPSQLTILCKSIFDVFDLEEFETEMKKIILYENEFYLLLTTYKV